MDRGRILVVDDSEDNRYALSLILSDHEVIEAANGEDAVARAVRDRPDCILLDVQMPGMDGLEVCRRLRAAPETRSVPIVLVTAHHRDTESVVAGLAAGADEYVTKPVAKQELLARVAAMLRIRELQERLERLNAALETQVRRRTEELRQIYATVPVGLYTLDPAGRFTSFNRHLEQLLGYVADEVVGRLSVTQIFEPGYDAYYWLDLCRREGQTACELRARRKDGSLVPVHDERVVRLDHLGERVGFTGYMQDLRRAHRLRDLLKQQETQAAVGRLAASIVHEVANPLGGVATYLDATLRRLDAGETISSAELRRGAGVMRDALRRTTDLLAHLRGVTRPALRAVTRVDVAAVLRDIRALMSHDLHRRGIEMALLGPPAVVTGDGGRLSQVFLNLITNARDAMQDGGKLTVEVAAEDSAVAIRFTDTGCGIAREHHERVFEFLYTTKGEAGTGYGLAISREIVEEHGGRIVLESEPGKGSTFTVLLPLASGPALA